MINLQHAVNEFQKMIETAIVTGGTDAKNNLIRSSVPISLIHEAVKTELVNHGIAPCDIFPRRGDTKGELNLLGSLKQKNKMYVLYLAG